MTPGDHDSKSSPASRPSLPDLYMPAMPPLGLITALRRYLTARRKRRELEYLLAHDDRLLTDLGYDRVGLRRELRRVRDRRHRQP